MNPPARPPAVRVSRRTLLRHSAAALTGGAFWHALAPLLADPDTRRFRIGACDWSIGKMASPDAFAVAKEIGLDGLQVSLGTEKDGMQLRQPARQETYRAAAAQTGVAIGSLAIGELNNIPYKTDPRTVDWVSDGIDVCQALNTKVILLAFFGNGDLRDDPKGTDEVVRRLQAVAPKAEKAGVILGIESWLSAEDHVAIIDRVGSPAVQVYYDVCNSTVRGYDIDREIRWLGKRQLICEFHAKENGFLLGQGQIDLPKVRSAMDDIGYSGWVQIEGAVPDGAPMLPSYQANLRYLRGVLAA